VNQGYPCLCELRWDVVMGLQLVSAGSSCSCVVVLTISIFVLTVLWKP